MCQKRSLSKPQYIEKSLLGHFLDFFLNRSSNNGTASAVAVAKNESYH